MKGKKATFQRRRNKAVTGSDNMAVLPRGSRGDHPGVVKLVLVFGRQVMDIVTL